MTQQQRGPVRDEVDDLRNIVDRLDLLMGNAQTSPSATSRSTSTAELIAALGERVDAIEDDVAEVRTLVNHLMTIATWQAKVTATLVDDRATADAGGAIDDRSDGTVDEGLDGGEGPGPDETRHDDRYDDFMRDTRSNGLRSERHVDAHDAPRDGGDAVDDVQEYGERLSPWEADRSERMPAGGWRRERDDERYGWEDRHRPPSHQPYRHGDHDHEDLMGDPPRRDGAPPDFGI